MGLKKKYLLFTIISSMLLPGCNFFDFSFDINEPQIALNRSKVRINQNSTFQLDLAVDEEYKNDIIWTSNNNLATVEDGLVKLNDTVSKEKVFTVSAYNKNSPQRKATCEFTIVGEEKEAIYDYTVFIYLCGSSLESDSDGGAATGDLKEIVKAFQNKTTDKVKFVIQTGGAKSWKYFQISNKAMARYEVNTKGGLTKVFSESLGNEMATEESLESFLSWGLDNYPSKQTALILWNHGSGIAGVCSDENSQDEYGNNNMLNTSEVAQALEASLKKANKDKLTWIGYDACLMADADIASINADYFDYMVASQETEWSEGWNYLSWVSKVIENPSIKPEVLLPQIADDYKEFYHTSPYNDASYQDSDACYVTLSVLDLKKINLLIKEFNSYASSLNINSFKKFNYIKNAYKNSYCFGVDEDGNLFGLADFVDFLNHLKKEYFLYNNIKTTNLETAINDLVICNCYCDKYEKKYDIKPCGLNIFVSSAIPNKSDCGLQAYPEDYDDSSDTRFNEWLKINNKYGYYAY